MTGTSRAPSPRGSSSCARPSPAKLEPRVVLRVDPDVDQSDDGDHDTQRARESVEIEDIPPPFFKKKKKKKKKKNNTTGRLKRREPGVVCSSPKTAEAEPSPQRVGRRGHCGGFVCSRVLGEMDAAARTRPGRRARRRLPDFEIGYIIFQSELQRDREHSRTTGSTGSGVSGAQCEHRPGQQRDFGVDPRREGQRPLGLNELGTRHSLYFRPVLCTAYPLSLSPATKAHEDDEGQAGREGHLGQLDVAFLRQPVRPPLRRSTWPSPPIVPCRVIRPIIRPARPRPFAQYSSTSTDVANYPPIRGAPCSCRA